MKNKILKYSLLNFSPFNVLKDVHSETGTQPKEVFLFFAQFSSKILIGPLHGERLHHPWHI